MMANSRTTLRYLAAVMAIACAGWMAPAQAQDEASSIKSSEAAAYLGLWNVSMEFGDLTLNFVDNEGMLRAILESDQQPEPANIDDIAKTDTGLMLKFDSGGFGILNVDVRIEGGGLVGTLGSEDGAFSVDLTGTKGEFGEGEETAESGELTEEQQRELARRRRGPALSEADYNGKAVKLQVNTIPSEGPDYAALDGVAAGAVARITVSSPVKMMTDTDMAFGDVVIEKENVAENYPGVYSIWLKKTGNGWSIVFNNKPDVWGTQHDPETDAGEVPATHSTADAATESLEATVTKDGDGGTIQIAWGTHVWSAKFKALDS